MCRVGLSTPNLIIANLVTHSEFYKSAGGLSRMPYRHWRKPSVLYEVLQSFVFLPSVRLPFQQVPLICSPNSYACKSKPLLLLVFRVVGDWPNLIAFLTTESKGSVRPKILTSSGWLQLVQPVIHAKWKGSETCLPFSRLCPTSRSSRYVGPTPTTVNGAL